MIVTQSEKGKNVGVENMRKLKKTMGKLLYNDYFFPNILKKFILTLSTLNIQTNKNQLKYRFFFNVSSCSISVQINNF